MELSRGPPSAISTQVLAYCPLKEIAAVSEQIRRMDVDLLVHLLNDLLILDHVSLFRSIEIHGINYSIESGLYQHCQRLKKHLLLAPEGQCLDDGASLDLLVVSVDQHVEEVDSLVRLIHALLKALVRVEVEARLHHFVEIESLLDILIDQFDSVDIALLVFKCGVKRLSFRRSEVQERVHFDLDAE